MSNPALWLRNPTGTAYRHPDGYGLGRVLGTAVVDARRRTKHLTDAECAAEFHAMHRRLAHEQWIEATSTNYTDRERTGQNLMQAHLDVLHRFATHDQAVK